MHETKFGMLSEGFLNQIEALIRQDNPNFNYVSYEMCFCSNVMLIADQNSGIQILVIMITLTFDEIFPRAMADQTKQETPHGVFRSCCWKVDVPSLMAMGPQRSEYLPAKSIE